MLENLSRLLRDLHRRQPGGQKAPERKNREEKRDSFHTLSQFSIYSRDPLHATGTRPGLLDQSVQPFR